MVIGSSSVAYGDLSIAAGQFAIAIGMFADRKLTKMAIVGTVVFSLAIAPLGVGSAFPCSVWLAIAAILFYCREARMK